MSSCFKNICDFFETIEEIYPIPFHTDLLYQWEEDVREYWFDCLGEEGATFQEQKIFEKILEFRKTFHGEAIFQDILPHDNAKENSWKWLLETTQVEQRTEAWYREKENILTASEISAIWSGPLTRARLIQSKVPKEVYGPFIPRLAVPRSIQTPMDWGVRYEPVVKEILEKQLNIKINDLGRIPHKSIPQLSASPDGLITEGPETLVGRLVEIKCPTTRKIKNDEVPFEYWAQMQIQLEVCDLEACEFVEVKFTETEEADAEGWIGLEQNNNTFEYKYLYSPTPVTQAEEGWNLIETYGWKLVTLRRVTQHRDRNWFAGIQKDIKAFWDDVKAAREGTWIAPPPRVKKQKVVKCAIVDSHDHTVDMIETNCLNSANAVEPHLTQDKELQ